MDETIALDSIQAIAASFGASFEAEKIVDTILEKDGTRYYKVRWVKYSWEPSASFAHLEHLIHDFWNQFEQNPDCLQDLTEKQVVDKQITKRLPQILIRESTTTNRNIIPSILTSVSTIDENIANVQPEENLHLELSSSIPQLSSLGDGSTNILSAMQQISSTQGLQKPASQVEVPTISTILKPTGSKKSRIPGEPKKRRKIPGNCSICGKHFKSTTNIAAHKKLHTEERQYECNECGRKFRRKLHLLRHQESHAGIKSYVCNICGSFFSSKWYMKAHAVIHTGDKPYKCDVCQKNFNNKANLNKHKLIHANNRPFVCNECGRTYRQSYDLKRHMSTHSVIKTFSCTQCDKSFARKTYLQRHLLKHGGDKKFSCETCLTKFFQRGHLNYHIKQQHGKSEMVLKENISETCSIESNTLNESEADNMEKQVFHKSEELCEQNDFLATCSDTKSASSVFLDVNENGYTGGNSQVVSSKQIYQSIFNTPEHNLSIAGNDTMENCGSDEASLSNPYENSSSDIVNIKYDVDERQRVGGTIISNNSVRLQSIQQSEDDVALSVLNSEHTDNYFAQREVLDLHKDENLYL